MDKKERAESIIKDILVNHLPRIQEGLEKGYVDENQILVMYDHAVRARILTEHDDIYELISAKLNSALKNLDADASKEIAEYQVPADVREALDEYERIVSLKALNADLNHGEDDKQ